ncbi:MAG: MBL fold metallo-hydrolase [Dehalococcoidia bacterium]
MQIVEGVYQIQIPLDNTPMGHVNTYLIKGDDGWVLVDTGWDTPSAFESLQSQLRDIGLDFRDITRILITHAHPDHFGMAGKIKGLSGAKVAMHRLEAETIQSRYWDMDSLLQQMGDWLRSNGIPDEELPALRNVSLGMAKLVDCVEPDWPLSGGEIIPVKDASLQVLWCPGHSPGHICFYDHNRKLLFAGDHILPEITPNVSLHVQSGPDPLGDYLKSLEMLSELDVEKVLPGHEYIFTNFQQRIEELKSHRKERMDNVMEAVEDIPQVGYDIASKVPWMEGKAAWNKLGPLDKRAAVCETLAHLEVLTNDHRIDKIKDEHVSYKMRDRK